jgi:hypothetical protein
MNELWIMDPTSLGAILSTSTLYTLQLSEVCLLLQPWLLWHFHFEALPSVEEMGTFFPKKRQSPNLCIIRCMRFFINLLKFKCYKRLHHGSHMVNTCINILKRRDTTNRHCTNMLIKEQNVSCTSCINPVQSFLACCTQNLALVASPHITD